MKLEIGVGGGRYAFSPKVQGDEVVYADVERPEKRVENFVICDAQFLPFQNNMFCEIIASHLIEHLERPHLFIREGYRTLTESGKIRIWCPNFVSLSATADATHRYVFNILSLRKVLLTCDFECLHHLPNIGSKLPQPLQFFAQAILLLLCNELYAEGVKRPIT
jgi:ubiquinone/menaquinone biosynthesis C-methylase UbiE